MPRTLSGKKLEVPVKRILAGTPPDDAARRGSLADPDALSWFVDRAALRSIPTRKEQRMSERVFE